MTLTSNITFELRFELKVKIKKKRGPKPNLSSSYQFLKYK